MASKRDVVIMGLGQLGGVFARALLRSGRTVHPLNRGDDPAALAQTLPDPEFVLVAVGEKDLDAALESLPESYRSCAVLIQNGLLPNDWDALDPTVAVVWFEKKKTIATNVILPTPIAGAHAAALVDALAGVDIPAEEIATDALADALVLKNLYILVFNLAGLATPERITVGELWEKHRDLVRELATDTLRLQEALLGRPVDHDAQLRQLEAAVKADPAHGARGRSAPARLARALAQIEAHGVDAPAIRRLAESAKPQDA
ncbi:MAG: hypothetical protein AAGE52_18775 [Myxococcota bacterium]